MNRYFWTPDPPRVLLNDMAPSHTDLMQKTVHMLGFAVVPGIVPPDQIENLISAMGEVIGAGQRGVLCVSEVARLARSAPLRDLVRHFVPGDPRPVRAIYFDKSAASNWSVGWHQDLTVAVRERVWAEGFGPWTIKQGVPHVQAPVRLLEQMITVRLHLDDCDESNGPLRVLGGSHKFGRIPTDQVRGLGAECPEILCRVGAGGALLMRPLLFHASSRSTSYGHRRVLHVEYAGADLPAPLRWYEEA